MFISSINADVAEGGNILIILRGVPVLELTSKSVIVKLHRAADFCILFCSIQW